MTLDDEIRRGLRALSTRNDVASTLMLIGETLSDACSEFTVADGVAVFKWMVLAPEIAADATRAERMEAVAKAKREREIVADLESKARVARAERQKDDEAIHNDWPNLLTEIERQAANGKELASHNTREQAAKVFAARLVADGFTVTQEGGHIAVGWGKSGADWCVKYHTGRGSSGCKLLQPKKEKATA